ncbi:cofilin family protein [Streptomyces sp. NPDC004838]
MTGHITVEPRCLTAFQELKSKRTVNTVIYRVDVARQAVVCAFEGNLTHTELLAALPADEPRTVAYHICFALPDGTRRTAAFLISWSPAAETAADEAGHQALIDLFDGVDVHVRAASTADLTYAALVNRACVGRSRRSATTPGGA